MNLREIAGGEPGGHDLKASLYELGLYVSDVNRSVAYYEQTFGYRFQPDEGTMLGVGPQRRLRLVSDADGHKGLYHAGFALKDVGQLASLRLRLEAAGIAVEADRAFAGYQSHALRFSDPDGNRMIFGVAASESVETAPEALPAHIQHVVFASTGIEAMLRFYRDIVGFGLSDLVENDAGLLTTFFAHCSEEHHSLAVFRADECRLDHHCFEAGDWSLIRDWGDHFAKLNIPLKWGPGRHGPGNNLFIFVHDPNGYWVEISAELEMLEAGRKVGLWPHAERTLNSWGTAFLRS